MNSKTQCVSARRLVEFNKFFKILLRRMQSLTAPAPELFFPSGELPEGRQQGQRVRRRRRFPCAGCSSLPPMPDTLSAAELGTNWGKSTRTQTLTAWEK